MCPSMLHLLIYDGWLHRMFLVFFFFFKNMGVFMSSKSLRSFSRVIWSSVLLYDVETTASQLCGQSRATPDLCTADLSHFFGKKK